MNIIIALTLYFRFITEDADDMSGDGGDDGDDGDVKQEYVKKEFVARPYASDTGVLEEV